MQRWEYLELYADSNHGEWKDSAGRVGPIGEQEGQRLVDAVNKLGEQGWEMAGVYGGSGFWHVLYFKRPKQ